MHEEKQPGYRFNGGGDRSDLSPDDSDQSACRGAALPRCREARRFRHVFGVRLRWPDGHVEFSRLLEGPKKQAATELTSPEPQDIDALDFDHPARTAFAVS